MMYQESHILRKLENLYLGSMPGRYYAVSDWREALKEKNIKTIVCLVSDEEIKEKSPVYLTWKKENRDIKVFQLPVPDFGIPDKKDRASFWKLAEDISKLKKNGTSVFIHCAAGIGRTGLFASAVLMCGGMSYDEAVRKVNAAGSLPETDEQRAFLNMNNK